MNNDYKEYKLTEDRILRVYQDIHPESPNDWKNTDCFLVYDHRQFTVKREGFDPKDIAEWYNASFRTLEYDGYYVFPVAAYIHSGVILNLTNSLKRQGWDTSVSGFVLVHKESITVDKTKHKTKEDAARSYAEDLIGTWNQYLSGEIYGFRVFKQVKYYKISEEKLNNLNIVNYIIDYISIEEFKEVVEELIELEEEDSCWGFYGSDIKTNGILDHISYKLLENE